MSDAFISYRRKPSAAVAQLLQEKLRNQHRIDAYLDVTRTDSTRVQFPERLMGAIAAAPTFICLLGDSTLESEWVRKEIQQAYEMGKHCIPVFQESYQPPSDPDAAINYLLDFDGVHIFDEQNLFVDESVAKIARLIARRPRRRLPLMAILAAVLLIIGIAAALLLMNGDDPSNTPATEIAQEDSATPDSAAQETAIAEAAQEQTRLAMPETPTPSDTPSPDPTATPQPSITPQPSDTPQQPTPSLSVDEIAGATVEAIATNNEANRQATASEQARLDADATATAFPLTQAAQATSAQQTQAAQAIAIETRVVELQATLATWTPVPTATATATPSNTPSNTPTATATNTPPPTATATATPGFEPVTANADWIPIIKTLGGVEMALVPAGCFMMGSTDEQIAYARSLGAGDWVEREKPVDEQCFDEPFWMGQYEVTNAEYAQFIEAGGYDNADYWTEAGWEWRTSNNRSGPADYNGFTGANQPRVGVSWYEVYAYTQWLSAETGLDFRLPTEAEWEYAARGPDGLIFPWGDEFIGDNLVYRDNSGNRTAEVGSRPNGASWVGALDMAGNVWKWVLSEYRDYPYLVDDSRNNTNINEWRALRGGSWDNGGHDARAASRSDGNPSSRSSVIGFRLVCLRRP